MDVDNGVQPKFVKEFGPRYPGYGIKVRVIDDKDVLLLGDH